MATKVKQPTRKPARVSGLVFAAGLVFLAFSTVMSFMLVYEHVTGQAIPGCGEGSPCARLAEGFGGHLALGAFAWPTAYIGFAYFLSALVAWIISRGALPASLRNVARLGMLGSVFFCVVIVVKWLLCPYCLAAHLGNAGFWISMELAKARTRRPGATWIAALVTFLVASGAVGAWDHHQQQERIARGEREMAESVTEMIRQSHAQVPPPEPVASQPANQPASAPVETGSAPVEPTPAAQSQPAEPTPASAPVAAEAETPFEGRYRIGAEDAPIRLVLFTSYQCPDCRYIETELIRLMKSRTDIAVSIKHFPFNSECNPYVSHTTQPNACWASRAAEAAGMIWGVNGFWKMHTYLFKIQGAFTKAEDLRPGFNDETYSLDEFVKVMTSPETLARVQADCTEAKSLGLFFTPMIFINGVELKGWYAPQALTRAVEALAATNPPRRTAKYDHPPLAMEKYVADWQEEPRLNLPEDHPAHTLGPADAKLRIVMWGDFQEEGTADMDAVIRAFIHGRTDAQYTYRHYPFNSDCNPKLPDQRHPYACRAAQAAEAAAQLGGEDAYWKMHIWLMEHRPEVNDQTLRQAATEMGLDADALFAAMDSPEVQAAIKQDIEAGASLPRLRIGTQAGVHAIPTIIINERWVPRFKLTGEQILDRIMEAALAGK